MGKDRILMREWMDRDGKMVWYVVRSYGYFGRRTYCQEASTSFPSNYPENPQSTDTKAAESTVTAFYNAYAILPRTRGCETSAMLMKISSAGWR